VWEMLERVKKEREEGTLQTITPTLKLLALPLCAMVPTANLYSMHGYVTHGSWVKWVMGQGFNGSLGSWIKLRDLSCTMVETHTKTDFLRSKTWSPTPLCIENLVMYEKLTDRLNAITSSTAGSMFIYL
jgi:hypothetical protein